MRGQKLKEFVIYFNLFYGAKGCYSYGREITVEEIKAAMKKIKSEKPKHRFDGDTYDRELVREAMFTFEEIQFMYSSANVNFER